MIVNTEQLDQILDLYARAPAESGYTRVASDVHPAAQGTFTYTPAAGDGTYSFYTVATESDPGG